MPSASPLHAAFCGVWCIVVCDAAVVQYIISPSCIVLVHPLSLSPMSAVAGPSSRPVQLQPSQQNVHPWEFTRRKRWADLLMTELSEAIVLVLSSRRKVLFCNPAV